MVRRMIETGKGIRAENIATVWTALPGRTSNCAGLIEKVFSGRGTRETFRCALNLTVEIVLAWPPLVPLRADFRPDARVLMQPQSASIAS